MPKIQNKKSSNTRVFVDFIPAELKQTAGNDWRIIYYCKDPGKEKLTRFRKRVPMLNSKKEREILAKRMCLKINEELSKGWSPFYSVSTQRDYILFSEVLDQYLKQNERKLKDKLIRNDTLRAYTSYTQNILKYMAEKDLSKMLVTQFTNTFVLNFLDHLYYEKGRSSTTSNNYLNFLSQIGGHMEDRKMIPSNPAAKIPKRKANKKKREILPHWLRDDVFKYWSTRSKEYLTLCLTTYFCFVRRTEVTKLLVKHVNIKDATIFVPGDASKNGRDGTVTIPKQLLPLIAEHISGAENSFYLFSNNNFKPGKIQLKPKKISDEWAVMRKDMNLESKYQFYSLKDTGITNLLLLGIPAKKVRDQARHHDIRITESYISRADKADEELRLMDFDF